MIEPETLVERTASIILAAGGGTRFEGVDHKLLAPLRGYPVVAHAVGHALDAGLAQTIVVQGATDLSDLMPDTVTLLHNPRWDEGIATSLALGIAAADARGFDAVVVGLGDQPFIPPSAWRAVATASIEARIAVATYESRRRNPVRLTRPIWSMLPSTGDEGARALMRERPELVVEVACDGEPVDIDTQADLRRWN